MDLVGVKLSDFDELFDFGNGCFACSSHHRVEVAGGFSVVEVAPSVSLIGFDDAEIGSECGLHDVHFAVEFTGFFAFGDEGSVSSFDEECGDTGSSSADAFGEGALRVEFEFEFTREVLAFKFSVFSDVAGDHFFDLPGLEKESEAEIVNAAVVANDGEVFDSRIAEGKDQVFGNAAKAKSAGHDGHPVEQFSIQGFGGGFDQFIHTSEFTGWFGFGSRKNRANGHRLGSSNWNSMLNCLFLERQFVGVSEECFGSEDRVRASIFTRQKCVRGFDPV